MPAVRLLRIAGLLLPLALCLLPLAWAQSAAAGNSAQPGNASLLSLGGRLYDNLWIVLGRPPPPGRHPLFPKEVDMAQGATWRCVSCHGWDYKGADGHLASLGKSPAFKSLAGVAGRSPQEIVSLMRSEPHRPMIGIFPDDLLLVLARFLGSGQHVMSDYFDAGGKARGDPRHGKDIYEGACARCHNAEGTDPLYGEEGDHSSLGWLARNRPGQAVHKIRNGVPGADMLSLRFLDSDSLASLLAYLQTLDPEK